MVDAGSVHSYFLDGCLILRYSYTIIQAPADYGSDKDELKEFLDRLSRYNGEIVAVIPRENRYLLIIYSA